MRLIIVSISSPDVHLDAWTPQAREDAFVLVELELSCTGGQGAADLFQIVVATPEGLRKHQETHADALGEVLSERAMLVVSDYSWPRVRRTLKDIVKRCEGADWTESVARLQRYFEWEYENYVMDSE